MVRKLEHALQDMLQAVERVEEITRERTLSDFETDWQLQWLVQRAIEIISEASRAIPDELKKMIPDIPWDSIKGIGNVLRHEYGGISDPLIWNIVIDELPRLKQALHTISVSTRSR